MKTTYTPAKNNQPELSFPLVVECISEDDSFYGGIVVFQDEFSFAVLHAPEHPHTFRKFGEIVDSDAISCFNKDYWRPVTNGQLVIEF